MKHFRHILPLFLMAAVGEGTAGGAAAEAQPPAPDNKDAKPAPVPRVKLELTFGDKKLAVLKYPFPVKAGKFPIKVNGSVCDAATTAGRGNSYTYFVVNNTSFYVAGHLPVDAEVSINFPEGYKFDDKLAPRVSNYKPKKKAAKAEGEAKPAGEGNAAVGEAKTDPAAGGVQGLGDAGGGSVADTKPADAPAAKRRK